jgi:hypothetical protein
VHKFTLRAEITRHMLNLAKQMVSGDLLESRNKLQEYPLCGDPSVFEDIMRVRSMQDRLWGHKVDDTMNDPWHWCAYISYCSVRWMRDPHKWTREDTDDFYDAMIETAAVCAAAAESIVRQRNENGRTFFEPASGQRVTRSAAASEECSG